MIKNKHIEIIEAIKNNPKKGYEMLYLHYGKQFLGFAIRKRNIPEDYAWDIIYQTIEVLIEKLIKYKFVNQKDFERFIFRVFINFLNLYYRQHREPEEIPLSSEILENIDKEDFERTKDIDSSGNVSLIRLTDALNKLSSDEKDILLMRANNFTYNEISKMMNIENKQLKVKHLRAKNKLIKIYQSQT